VTLTAIQAASTSARLAQPVALPEIVALFIATPR